MLTVNGIDVCYGDLQVLWDITIEARDKEILVLIGANSAGKSTTIKTISSLVTPTKGSIEFDCTSIDNLPPYDIIQLGIVHVPEGRRLFPEMIVEENLIMGSFYGQAHCQKPPLVFAVVALLGRPPPQH